MKLSGSSPFLISHWQVSICSVLQTQVLSGQVRFWSSESLKNLAVVNISDHIKLRCMYEPILVGNFICAEGHAVNRTRRHRQNLPQTLQTSKFRHSCYVSVHIHGAPVESAVISVTSYTSNITVSTPFRVLGRDTPLLRRSLNLLSFF